jgi:hypothetical protein
LDQKFPIFHVARLDGQNAQGSYIDKQYRGNRSRHISANHNFVNI